MLLSKVHAIYDRVAHRDKPQKEAVPVSVGDSPSQRVTRPMNAIEDDGDRDDGENSAEANEQRALDELPADRPLVIDDEPTARHH